VVFPAHPFEGESQPFVMRIRVNGKGRIAVKNAFINIFLNRFYKFKIKLKVGVADTISGKKAVFLEVKGGVFL
jgi:hypothetical protein